MGTITVSAMFSHRNNNIHVMYRVATCAHGYDFRNEKYLSADNFVDKHVELNIGRVHSR